MPTRPVAAHIGNDVAPLVERVVAIVEEARSQVVRTVNSAMVISYWHIGRELVEFVQRGAARAEYGDQVIDLIAQRLQARVGRGYSSTNLKYFRIFYQVYTARAPVNRHEARDDSGAAGVGRIGHESRDQLPADLSGFSSSLSWTHYRTLTRSRTRRRGRSTRSRQSAKAGRRPTWSGRSTRSCSPGYARAATRRACWTSRGAVR